MSGMSGKGGAGRPAPQGGLSQRPSRADAQGFRSRRDPLSALGTLQAEAGNRAVSQLLGRGVPLEPQLREDMEARFGTGFEDVRIHADPLAERVTAALSAKALTIGSQIAFGGGRFEPASVEGRRLLAHELAHVVQQRRGGSVPQLEGGAFEASLEAGAERAADATVTSNGPAEVAGASAPGIALSPIETGTSDVGVGRASVEREIAIADGKRAWRDWLTQVESIEFDDAAVSWTITIEGQRYALHEAQKQRNFDEAHNAIGDRLTALKRAALDARQIDEGIRAITETGAWEDRLITAAIERFYGVKAPGDALNSAVVEALAYANQADDALRDGHYVDAFDLAESGRVPAERAARLAADYQADLIAASQSMQDTLVGGWADVLQALLGVLKGVGSQVTDLADTAFWSADELRTMSGGSTTGLMLLSAAAGPMGMVVSTPLSALTTGHDTLKAMGVTDRSGHVSTSAAYSDAMEGVSKDIGERMGSVVAKDAILTPFDMGDLVGSVGVQVLLASTGVKEVMLVADFAGAVSSLRTVVNTYRDNPDWATDTYFWSGAIGVALGVLGLAHWSGTNRLVEWGLKTGQIATLAPPIRQFMIDLENTDELEPAEQNRRLVEDVKALTQAVVGLLQSAHASRAAAGGADAPPPNGAGGTKAATLVPAVDAVPVTTSPPPVALPDTPPQSQRRQVLPFKPRLAPNPASKLITGDAEVIPLPTEQAASPPSDSPEPVQAQQPVHVVQEEALLARAVGAEPPVARSGPSLFYDADAPVASTGSGSGSGSGGGGGRPPAPSPVPPSRPPQGATPSEPGPRGTGGRTLEGSRVGGKTEILTPGLKHLYVIDEAVHVAGQDQGPSRRGDGEGTVEGSTVDGVTEVLTTGGLERLYGTVEPAASTGPVQPRTDAETAARVEQIGGEPSPLPEYQLQDPWARLPSRARQWRERFAEIQSNASRTRLAAEAQDRARAAEAEVIWPEAADPGEMQSAGAPASSGQAPRPLTPLSEPGGAELPDPVGAFDASPSESAQQSRVEMEWPPREGGSELHDEVGEAAPPTGDAEAQARALAAATGAEAEVFWPEYESDRSAGLWIGKPGRAAEAGATRSADATVRPGPPLRELPLGDETLRTELPEADGDFDVTQPLNTQRPRLEPSDDSTIDFADEKTEEMPKTGPRASPTRPALEPETTQDFEDDIPTLVTRRRQGDFEDDVPTVVKQPPPSTTDFDDVEVTQPSTPMPAEVEWDTTSATLPRADAAMTTAPSGGAADGPAPAGPVEPTAVAAPRPQAVKAPSGAQIVPPNELERTKRRKP